MDQHDLARLPRNDRAVLATGVLVFIASFFPYYGLSGAHLGPVDATWNSWHGWSTFALLLSLTATVLTAVLVLDRQNLPAIQVSWDVVVTGVSAVAAMVYVIRAFTLQTASLGGISLGLKWGAYIVMALMVAQAVFAFLRTRDAGDPMPWERPATPPPPAA